MCAFNYRFVPAVRLARELIDAGELGELPSLPRPLSPGLGRHDGGDLALRPRGRRLGRARRSRRARRRPRPLPRRRDRGRRGFLRTFIPGREVDDAVEATVEFERGAVGTLEATRLALGRRNAFQWEINGTKGSLAFDMERLNELQVFRADGDRARGFKTVLVSEANHPFWEHWWPPGPHHRLGRHIRPRAPPLPRARSPATTDVAPHGATFEDGYRAAEVCDAIVRSSESGRRETLDYRTLT